MAARAYSSKVVEKETRHTLSLLEPQLRGCRSFLDVGCGAGYVARDLAASFEGEIGTVDFTDCRSAETPGFSVFDGIHLPFADDRFDLVALSFVLHHVPDVLKPLLLAEARRVARQRIFVLEDTPVTLLDRLVSWRHGRRFRRKIGSREHFGFLTTEEWVRLFGLLDLRPVEVRPLSRWCRDYAQPFARTAFVIDVGKP
jgi:SAM-dependent methyltransferase